MTKILKGVDPIPGPEFTKHTWKTIRDGHQVLWVGSNRALFYHRPTGEFSVYPYDWKAAHDADPFLDATSSGSWEKRGIVGSQLLWLENMRLLEWRPSSSGSQVRLWAFNPGAAKDPIVGAKPLYEEAWTSITTRHELVYLGGDLLLKRELKGPTDSWVDLYRVQRANLKEPLKWAWNCGGQGLGSDHRLSYLGRDRVVALEPRRRRHPEEPGQDTSRYQVFRVERAPNQQVLPRPVVAEGLYYSVHEGQDLVFVGDPYKRVIAWERKTGKIVVWGVETNIPELPEDTAVDGAQLLRKGNEYVVVATLSKLFPGNAPPTIAGIATKLQLSDDRVFDELLARPENDHAVQALYKAQVAPAYPGRAKAVAALKRAGHTPTANDYVGYTKTPYVGWGVQVTKPVWLPLSPGFKDVLADAKKQRELQQRFDAAKPTFDSLRKRVDAIELLNVKVHLAVKSFRGSVEKAAKDLGLVVAMQKLLGLMLDMPAKADELSADRRKEITGLRDRVDALHEQHSRHVVTDPKFSWGKDARKERDDASQKLFDAVREQALIDESVRLVRDLDVAPPDLRRHVFDTCLNSYVLLLLTERADQVLKDQLEPLLEQLGRDFDPAGLPATGRAEFDKELVRDASTVSPTPGSWAAALTITKTSAGTGAASIGNMPGPASLFVGLYQIAAPNFLVKYASLPHRAGPLAARLYKALCQYSGLARPERLKLLDGIKRGFLNRAQEVDWAKSFMHGRSWSGAMGIFNLIVFGATVASDPDITLKTWIDCAGSLSAAGAAGIQFASTFKRWAELARVGGSTPTANALGCIGGIAAMVSGGITAKQEFGSSDNVGGLYALGGAAAGGLSVAGFLIGSGVMVTAGGITAPLGVVLMVAGAVVGIGVGIAGTVRDLTTEKTHTVFEHLVEQYERTESTYHWVSKLETSLETAFEAVKKQHHPGWFAGFMVLIRPVPADTNKILEDGGIERLNDVGFSAAVIAACVGYEFNDATAAVEKRLALTRKPGQ